MLLSPNGIVIGCKIAGLVASSFASLLVLTRGFYTLRRLKKIKRYAASFDADAGAYNKVIPSTPIYSRSVVQV